MEYYSALKRKEILTYATVWMNLVDIMLGKVISQKTKGQILHNSTFYEVPRIVQFMDKESRLEVTRGWREGKGELLFEGSSVSVWIMKRFCRWMVVMVA